MKVKVKIVREKKGKWIESKWRKKDFKRKIQIQAKKKMAKKKISLKNRKPLKRKGLNPKFKAF